MIDMYVWVQEEEGEEKTNYKNFQKIVLQPPSIRASVLSQRSERNRDGAAVVVLQEKTLSHSVCLCHCRFTLY